MEMKPSLKKIHITSYEFEKEKQQKKKKNITKSIEFY